MREEQFILLVVDDISIDHRVLHERLVVKQVTVGDDQIAVLPDLERPHAMAHAKENWTEILIFILIAGCINFAGAVCCYVGMFFTMPLVACAQWLFFQAHKDDIYAKASEAGLALA